LEIELKWAAIAHEPRTGRSGAYAQVNALSNAFEARGPEPDGAQTPSGLLAERRSWAETGRAVTASPPNVGFGVEVVPGLSGVEEPAGVRAGGRLRR
jgi:hypothetical protein